MLPVANPDKLIVASEVMLSPMTRSKTVVHVWGEPTAEVTAELLLSVLWKKKLEEATVIPAAEPLAFWAIPVKTTFVPPVPPGPLLIVVVEPLKFTPP